ncbi:MAG: Nre family DNA repair protein, partial [Thermoplasmata archaeon]
VSMDYEGVYKRKEYANNIGGAYYAARLAVMEYLYSIRRNASIIVLRRVSPDYYAPLGVWVIRESIRKAMRTRPEIFDTIEDAKKKIYEIRKWYELSYVLRNIYYQRGLFDFDAV